MNAASIGSGLRNQSSSDHDELWVMSPESVCNTSMTFTHSGMNLSGPLYNTKMSTYKLLKTTSWDLPEGTHQAEIRNVRLQTKCVTDKQDTELILDFDLVSLVHPRKIYRAKRVYKSFDGVILGEDLDSILGDKITRVVNLAGEIIPEGIAIMKGMLVDIEVVHHQGHGHPKPYCSVAKVRKAGELTDHPGDTA